MKRTVVIGCGFAGVSAAQNLAKYRGNLDVTVIDRNPFFNFLPLLPDVIGRNLHPDNLVYPIKSLSEEFGFSFIEEEVQSVVLEKNTVYTAKREVVYDYPLISSGSETNFYGNSRIKQCVYKLDDAKDAGLIRDAVSQNNFDCYLLAGGGYTGIEIAANLRIKLNMGLKDNPILIVEKAPAILGPLPRWIKDYAAVNLKKLNIRIVLNSSIAEIENNRALLSNGETFNNAMVIWAAGVKTPDFVQGLNVQKSAQGRLKVDPYLRIRDNCFVAGDSAYFANNSSAPLRMAVQFAINQGLCASSNIARSIAGKSLCRYRHLDLGYIIPMANNNSCGEIFGFGMKGRIPTLLHYIMCVYRSYGLKNKFGLAADLLQNRK